MLKQGGDMGDSEDMHRKYREEQQRKKYAEVDEAKDDNRKWFKGNGQYFFKYKNDVKIDEAVTGGEDGFTAAIIFMDMLYYNYDCH